jgi:hypothetical protein
LATAPPDSFSRETGCTEAEWLGWLPGAVGRHALRLGPAGEATIGIDSGRLRLQWQVLPPRQLGLARLPRLAMHYRFEGLDDAARSEFMRYFDLYMHRGGG